MPVDELTAFVDQLATRIARFPPDALALAKRSILDADELSLVDGVREEQYRFARLLRTPEARRRMRAFLDAGGQTRDAERRVGGLSGEL